MNRDIDKYLNYAKKCFKEDPPPCSCNCPFKLDVRSFTGKIARGNFNSAYREYRNAVVFPEIVSKICEAPCEAACVRVENDGAAVSLLKLEAACLEFSNDRKSIRYDLPRKNERIAVIGAGPSGLACAQKLASRMFHVTVIFAEAEWGGGLAFSKARDVYKDEIEAALKGLPVEFRPMTVVREIEPLFDEGFRAVYIATGKGGETFGYLDTLDPNSLGSGTAGVFIGGEVLGAPAAEAIEHGSRASRSIEKFLQTGAMDGIPETYASWPVNEYYYRPIPPAPPEDAESKEGAVSEAERCADCECSACIDICPMLKSAKRTPKKITADVTTTINKIEQQTRRIANRLINACNLCGLCKEVCPAEVDLGECMREARKALFEQNGMPEVFHDYYIRDLEHALSEESYFEKDGGKYLFFPGCQTGASFPEYVLKPYEAMLKAYPDTGVLVTCCGVPAEWAGDEKRADELLERIHLVWEKSGRPTMVCSCLTCRNKISEKLPEIPVISFFEWMGSVSCETLDEKELYIFDPCAAVHDDGAGAAVRNLLLENGQSFSDGEYRKCCGFGGHIFASNPELYNEIVLDRVSESDRPYLVYCSNCRDAFAAQGKQCRHVFDVIFGTGNGNRAAPEIADRRRNRRIVKRRLAELFGGENTDEDKTELLPKLMISDELAAKMERELLSAEDVRNIIRNAESTKMKLYDKEDQTYIAHGSVGVYTCWVIYKEYGAGFRVSDVYTHRLRATEEL